MPIVIKKSFHVMVLYGVFLFGAYEIPLLLGRQSPQVITLFITDKLSRFNLLDIPQGHVMILLYLCVVGLVSSVFLVKPYLVEMIQE